MLLDNDVHTLHLVVRPGGPLAPPEEAELLGMLRAEITGLDVESIGGGLSIRPPESVAPEEIDAIVVGLSPTIGALTTLLSAVGGWLNRRAGGHVVEIHLEGDLLELGAGLDQGDEVAAFVLRHHRP